MRPEEHRQLQAILKTQRGDTAAIGDIGPSVDVIPICSSSLSGSLCVLCVSKRRKKQRGCPFLNGVPSKARASPTHFKDKPVKTCKKPSLSSSSHHSHQSLRATTTIERSLVPPHQCTMGPAGTPLIVHVFLFQPWCVADQTKLGIITGNPGVFFDNPHPYP